MCETHVLQVVYTCIICIWITCVIHIKQYHRCHKHVVPLQVYPLLPNNGLLSLGWCHVVHGPILWSPHNLYWAEQVNQIALGTQHMAFHHMLHSYHSIISRAFWAICDT